MMPRIFCGTFEAEAYWREPDLARLPSLMDRGALRVVEAMDEMLFAFCNSTDCLVTARQMDDAHADYLHAIGFAFERNRFDLVEDDDAALTKVGIRRVPSIFERMGGERLSQPLARLFPAGARLEPFAVLPGASEVAQRFALNASFPAQDVIRRVNTKAYALQMRDRLELLNPGVIVEDVQSLLEVGAALLCRGPILVKDDYGVSGKGNQLIETGPALHRIVRYVAGQVEGGHRMRFVVEPYLAKRVDFSCQFQVDEGGDVTVISIQELLNHGLAFGASCAASAELMRILDQVGYINLIERMGSLMRADGYHGDVCVDSMILKDDTVIPIVEINARKSMSLIKHAVDRFLAPHGRRGRLTYVSTVTRGRVAFCHVLEVLDREGLLFTVDRPWGVLPLTSRTMFAGESTGDDERVRGKLYMTTVTDQPDQYHTMMGGICQALQRAGILVTN